MKLVFQHNRLELHSDDTQFGKPLFVDFENKRYQNIARDELLLKAIGFKPRDIPSVIDLTAGLGSDAYLMYKAGCQLQLVERSPIIAALLQDGLKRAGCDLPLYIGEAMDFLHECLKTNHRPDIIYFDPIFPEKTKTALARKSARILRAIAGEDLDAAEVFKLALKIAKKRVVVKRPLYGETIDPIIPNIIYKGKSIRFDIYLVNND